MERQPISEAALWDEILSAEGRMNPQVFRFWETIKIFPEKWRESRYSATHDGSWVVAIMGSRVLCFDDIEEEFKWSAYLVFGTISEGSNGVDKLEIAIQYGLNYFE